MRSRSPGQVSDEKFSQVFGSISFFVNAGIRFVEEICKLRAMTEMWADIGRERYGVTDDKALRFRYGVQVNSLGLTEAQPENNVQRIVLEMLAVTLSKDARARSVQLPAWNEALGLPRPWDQQWSLRMQQVLAFETDLLEYGDLFEGSVVVEARTAELREAAQAELDDVLSLGGAFEAVETLKSRLVSSMAARTRRIESGEQKVIGVNDFVETADSPLGGENNIMKVDHAVEQQAIDELDAWRSSRDQAAVEAAIDELRRAAVEGDNVMPPSIALAKAGGTTGEWGTVMREVFGEYRAPTGVGGATASAAGLGEVADYVKSIPGGPPKFLVAKPGLDGHSSGPSRSPSPRATPGWRSSTPGSVSRPNRSQRRRVTRIRTSSGSRSSRDRICSSSPMCSSTSPRWASTSRSSSAASSPRTTVRGWPTSGSPGCTRRRTSRSPRSCATSPTSRSPTAPGSRRCPPRDGQTSAGTGLLAAMKSSSAGPDSKLVISA